jgi:hypothetical protein
VDSWALVDQKSAAALEAAPCHTGAADGGLWGKHTWRGTWAWPLPQ